MLVSNKRYDEGDIVAFKILTGDEIVARIKEDTATEFVVSKPCTVLPSPKGIGMIQSLYTANQDLDVRLLKTHVIMHNPMVKEISNYYIEVTTGIKPVTTGSLVI